MILVDKFIRAQGVHGQQSLDLLFENNIFDISFDCRPSSLNFISLNIINELLNNNKEQIESVRFLFGDEKIEIINELYKRFEVPLGINSCIEFDNSRQVFDEISLPFYARVYTLQGVKNLLLNKYRKGFILSTDLLEDILLGERVAQFHEILGNDFLKKQRVFNFEIDTTCQRAVNLKIPSSIKIKKLILNMDSKIESHYRVVDPELLKKSLSFISENYIIE